MAPPALITSEELVEYIRQYQAENNLHDVELIWSALLDSGHDSPDCLFRKLASYRVSYPAGIMRWSKRFYSHCRDHREDIRRLLGVSGDVNPIASPNDSERRHVPSDRGLYPLRELPLISEGLGRLNIVENDNGDSVRMFEKEAHSFPPEFDSANKTVLGQYVTKHDWTTLRGDMLWPSVIMSWLSLMQLRAGQDVLVLPFTSTNGMKHIDHRRIKLVTWLRRHKCETKNIWLIPYLSTKSHITLFIVVRNIKTCVFLDPLHLGLPDKLKASFFPILANALPEPVDSNEWTFYQPYDHGKQDDESHNCAIFVSAWIYMVCERTNLAFTEDSTVNFRKFMATRLSAAPEDSPGEETLSLDPVFLKTTSTPCVGVTIIPGSPGDGTTEKWLSTISVGK